MTRFLAAFVLAAGVLAACDGGTPPPVATTVVVTPGTAAFASVGQTEQFSAEVRDQNGSPMTGVTVSWASSDIGVANVTSAGVVTASGNGTAQIRATAEGITGSASITVDQVPESISKTAGDAQTGEAGDPLPISPTVEVKDALGAPVVGASVTFEVVGGGGTVATQTVLTGATGRASTTWTLGGTVGAQTLRARVGTLEVEFTATGQVGILSVSTTALDRARQTLPYTTSLQAKGGNGGGYTWSIASGTLPPGLTLTQGGALAGTPTTAGTFTPTFRVQDGGGGSATRALTLTVCEPPLQLALGANTILDASAVGTCGVYLPSANGAAYRITLHRPSTDVNATSTSVSLTMEGDGVSATAAAASPALAAAAEPALQAPSTLQRGIERSVARAEATERFHEALRADEARLLARLPREGLLAPQGPRLRAAYAAFQAAPDTLVLNVPVDATSCDLSTARSNTAVKLGENQHVAIYQTVSQRTTAPISTASVNMMLDFYENYGDPVIQQYFGGTSDVNGDGILTVLATPDVGAQIAAFVWSGDFFDNSPGVCPASNEREMIYFNADVINDMDDGSSYQALATFVHEAKHVSSLYKRVATQPFHPSFIEEGTAEIAGEMATRLAWAATGGPAVGEKVTRQDFVSGNQIDVTPENYGIFLRMARVAWYLSSQPNGVSASLTSQQNGIYGSGWLFHRFVGDAYGNAAASALADQTLFRTQNDSATASGFTGFPTFVGGKSYTDVLLEYAVALTYEGTPQAPARTFTTYDFPTAAELFRNPDPAGTFPWPVTKTCNGLPCPTSLDSSNTDTDDGVVHAAQFGDHAYPGALGPGGVRIHEFESNGTGTGAQVDVTAPSGIKVIVARVR
ncbi:MAG: Ig-like domain-containing protein [Gemmatimonadetes bacterium]|nr:Ig-like domain-containing protein [Gemmatimonadota bacterium]